MTTSIKQNSGGITLEYNITDYKGEPLNLTGSTITFNASGGDVAKEITKTCTIVDADSGVCSCTLTTGDTDITGTFSTEVSVDYGDGVIFITIDRMRFRILPTIG